jgi:hypothetical protein
MSTFLKAMSVAVLVLGAGSCAADRADENRAGDDRADDVPAAGEPVAAAADAEGGVEGSVEVLHALRGSAQLDGSQLTITTDPGITWIADRPARSAGRMGPSGFIAAWRASGFDQDPPNAVLMTDSQSVPIELTSLTAGAGPEQLTFEVTALEGSLPSGDLGPVELFIDDAIMCGTALGWHFQLSALPAGATVDANCDDLQAAITPWFFPLVGKYPVEQSFTTSVLGVEWTCRLTPYDLEPPGITCDDDAGDSNLWVQEELR